MPGLLPFEKIDFSSKPERYLREILDFLKSERGVADNDLGFADK